jgi:chitinase
LIELLGYKDHAVTFNRNANGKDFWKFKPKTKSDKYYQQEMKRLEKEKEGPAN